MEHEDMYESFVKFLGKEFKVQYAYFFKQLQSYKEMPSEVQPGKALIIYQKFVKKDSFLSLELDNPFIAPIEAVLLNEVRALIGKLLTD